MSRHPEQAPVNFEQALAELESVVRTLEDPTTSLDDALAQYERGVRLLRQCQQRLEQAELRIRQLTSDANGQPILLPFEHVPRSLTDSAAIPLGQPPTPSDGGSHRPPKQSKPAAGWGNSSDAEAPSDDEPPF